LATEKPTNLSIVGMIMMLDGIFEKDAVVTMVQHRVIPKFPRFSSIVNNYKFSHLPYYDCAAHISVLDVKEGMDNEENLPKLIGPLQNQPLDLTKPLWSITIIHLQSENMTALYWRIHHCIGDGTSLAMLLSSISDEHWGKDIREPKKPSANIFHFIGIYFKLFIFLIGIVLVILHWFKGFLVGLIPGRSPKKLKADLSTENTVAWDRKIITVKKAKDIISHIENSFSVKQHITLNDLMMSCMTAAISRYYRETFDERPHGLPIAIPVNLNPTTRSLGNKIGTITMILPMDIEDPVDRVLKVSKISASAKKLPEAPVSFNMTKILTLLPHSITNFCCNLLCTQIYCIMSNVRGSPFTLTFDDHEMKGLVGLVPAPNGVSVAAGIASYDNWIVGTLNCDKNTISDPSRIIRYFKEEFQKLEETYLSSSTASKKER